jgi:hypothetical protein
MKLAFIFFLPFLFGCAIQQLQPNAKDNLSELEKREFSQIEELIAKGNFEVALGAARGFRSKHPRSKFTEFSRLYEAQCLEGAGQPQEGLLIYRAVILKTEKYQPEIASMAFYRMASAYEALGDDIKMVAALLDAKSRAKYLPPEISEAQIPAKLAAAYARQGQYKESVKYLTAADEGLNSLLGVVGRNVEKSWLAQIYFEMGSVSSNQLSIAIFEDFVESQKMVQVYLLKALKLNEKTWSDRSLAHLQKTYLDLFTQLASIKNDINIQGRLAGSFNDLLEKTDLYRPLSDEAASAYEQVFYKYVDEVRKKTDQVIFGNASVIPLTEESKMLNNIKRAGRVKADSFLPEESNSKIYDPPKTVPTEDPNL